MTRPSARRYVTIPRDSWSGLGSDAAVQLTAEDLRLLGGVTGPVSRAEVVEVFMPLARYVHMHAAAHAELQRKRRSFVHAAYSPVPFVVGIAGSVAVGKTTATRVIEYLTRLWPEHPVVEVVRTDGFLYPNEKLRRKNLMERKGFPESYDRLRLLSFMEQLKSGADELEIPVYSHLDYDIVPNQRQIVRRADVVIVEGINVLQPSHHRPHRSDLAASDLFDLSIYVDAEESDIRQWYIERFLKLCETAFTQPTSYFHAHSKLTKDEAIAVADGIWRVTNGPNLRENIGPTAGRADIILRKGPDHEVHEVELRKG